MERRGQLISAQVILKSRDEHSPYAAGKSRANGRLGDYMPDFEEVIEAARYFRDIGFHVTPSHISLRIEGEVPLFERVFGLGLTPLVNDAWGDTFIEVEGTLDIPRVLEDVVVNVVFNEDAMSNHSRVRRYLLTETQF